MNILEVGYYNENNADKLHHVIGRYDVSESLESIRNDINTKLINLNLTLVVSFEIWDELIEQISETPDGKMYYVSSEDDSITLTFQLVSGGTLSSSSSFEEDKPLDALLLCHGNLHKDPKKIFEDIVDLNEYRLTYLDNNPKYMELAKCKSRCIIGDMYNSDIIEEAVSKSYNGKGYDLVCSVYCPIGLTEKRITITEDGYDILRNILTEEQINTDKRLNIIESILVMLQTVYEYLKEGGTFISNNIAHRTLALLEAKGVITGPFVIALRSNTSFIIRLFLELSKSVGYTTFRIHQTASNYYCVFTK